MSKTYDVNELNDEDIWDDSLLIKAYDKAVNDTKKKIEKELVKEMSITGTSTPEKTKWRVGMPCRAIFSSDGLEYEANIKSINKDGTCVVVFVGYENEETVMLEDLTKTEGNRSREKQMADALTEKVSDVGNLPYELPSRFDHEVPQSRHMAFPPPPPIPQSLREISDEKDAFSAMLMSWYMSGYHTGYYQGLMAKKKQRPIPRNE